MADVAAWLLKEFALPPWQAYACLHALAGHMLVLLDMARPEKFGGNYMKDASFNIQLVTF